jgi:hypothetical protein
VLTGCISQSNPPSIQPYLNRPLSSQEDVYLIEIKGISGIPAMMSPHLLLDEPGRYFADGSAEMIPSVSDYLKNESYWQRWHSDGILSGYEHRIVTLLPKGSIFKVTNYNIPSAGEEMLDMESSAEITIMSGLAQGNSLTISSGWLRPLLNIPIE